MFRFQQFPGWNNGISPKRWKYSGVLQIHDPHMGNGEKVGFPVHDGSDQDRRHGVKAVDPIQLLFHDHLLVHDAAKYYE